MWRPHLGLSLLISGRLEGQDSRNNCLKAQLLLFQSTHYGQQKSMVHSRDQSFSRGQDCQSSTPRAVREASSSRLCCRLSRARSSWYSSNSGVFSWIGNVLVSSMLRPDD